MTQGPARILFQRSTQAGRSQQVSPFGTSHLHHSHFGRRNSFHQALSFAHIAVIILLLLLAPTAEAGPKKAFHALANHITLDLAAGASSGFASAGTFHCRRVNGPEPCTERYGSAVGGEVARGVFTLGMIGLSEYGRRHHFKEWTAPAAGTAAFNTYWGIREWRTHAKHEDGSRVGAAAFRHR